MKVIRNCVGRLSLVSRWVDVTTYNICRAGGGLGLGVRFRFPVTLLYSEADRRSVWSLDFTVGQLVISFDLKLPYERHKAN